MAHRVTWDLDASLALPSPFGHPLWWTQGWFWIKSADKTGGWEAASHLRKPQGSLTCPHQHCIVPENGYILTFCKNQSRQTTRTCPRLEFAGFAEFFTSVARQGKRKLFSPFNFISLLSQLLDMQELHASTAQKTDDSVWHEIFQRNHIVCYS